MKRQKWVFDSENARIVVEDDSSNVLYTSDEEDLKNVPDHVFKKIVDLHNADIDAYHLGSDGDIDEYLLNESSCTQDAREIIVEELFANYYNRLSQSVLPNQPIAGEWITRDGQIYSMEDGKTFALMTYFDKEDRKQIRTGVKPMVCDL